MNRPTREEVDEALARVNDPDYCPGGWVVERLAAEVLALREEAGEAEALRASCAGRAARRGA